MRWTNMKIYSREEVLTEAKKLAEMLANTEEIERFKQVEAKINENQKVQRLVTKIKTLQKQAVNLQAYEKQSALKIVEETIDEAQKELDSIPIVEEFQDIQDRKSTRLNSSHVSISYAVFCLKKKNICRALHATK